MKGTVLIVDDQQEYARFLNKLLVKFNYQTRVVHTAGDARIAMKQFCPDVVLMDKNLPDADGIELVAELKRVEPNTQFIVITGHASIKSAVLSAQRGAMDYLAKPCEIEEVLLAVDNAMSKKSLTEEVQLLRSTNSRSSIPAKPQNNQPYKTPAMKHAMELAQRATRQKGTLMLIGESGTGKERLARWVHTHSSRKEGPFFSLNMGALSHQTAEIELFGHEPGAYGNARTRKKGLLELADGGTLLINEIERMDPALQMKLLHFFENRSIMRLGGEELIPLDTRVFVSCRVDLSELLKTKQFLDDLYYRINVFPIHLPPLRERKNDIIVLAREILELLATDLGLTPPPALTAAANKKLCNYRWPGNIRELRNVLERTLMLGNETEIDENDLPMDEPEQSSWHILVSFPQKETLHDVTREVTRKLIEEALQRGQTKQEAAKLLGLSRHALAHQMKALDIK
ncbi:MAG: sigma-54-dependent Fis family transcriptional regulator [Deltaproteobacteria bacterium]|nr:sigma-54-dependent Fis family transcriptional regulator [Deltaproteobacteria bacterium]MBN2674562.1 sigma-54-dependent Fis family transcriptional regulator [Deltaproteobacteria bacterium]